MTVIVSQGKANLAASHKVRTGNLSSSWTIRTYTKKAMARGGFTKKGHHAHLIDRGTDERYTKKGAYRGSISKGNPNHGSLFYTSAVHMRADDALQELERGVYEEIKRILTT